MGKMTVEPLLPIYEDATPMPLPIYTIPELSFSNDPLTLYQRHRLFFDRGLSFLFIIVLQVGMISGLPWPNDGPGNHLPAYFIFYITLFQISTISGLIYWGSSESLCPTETDAEWLATINKMCKSRFHYRSFYSFWWLGLQATSIEQRVSKIGREQQALKQKLVLYLSGVACFYEFAPMEVLFWVVAASTFYLPLECIALVRASMCGQSIAACIVMRSIDVMLILALPLGFEMLRGPSSGVSLREFMDIIRRECHHMEKLEKFSGRRHLHMWIRYILREETDNKAVAAERARTIIEPIVQRSKIKAPAWSRIREQSTSIDEQWQTR